MARFYIHKYPFKQDIYNHSTFLPLSCVIPGFLPPCVCDREDRKENSPAYGSTVACFVLVLSLQGCRTWDQLLFRMLSKRDVPT